LLKSLPFEPDLAVPTPSGEPPQCFVAPMPPIKDEKTMDAGAAYDQLPHEALADVGFAELAGERDTPANHHPRADTQIFHDRVMNRASGVVEENVDAGGAGFLLLPPP